MASLMEQLEELKKQLKEKDKLLEEMKKNKIVKKPKTIKIKKVDKEKEFLDNQMKQLIIDNKKIKEDELKIKKIFDDIEKEKIIKKKYILDKKDDVNNKTFYKLKKSLEKNKNRIGSQLKKSIDSLIKKYSDTMKINNKTEKEKNSLVKLREKANDILFDLKNIQRYGNEDEEGRKIKNMKSLKLFKIRDDIYTLLRNNRRINTLSGFIHQDPVMRIIDGVTRPSEILQNEKIRYVDKHFREILQRQHDWMWYDEEKTFRRAHIRIKYIAYEKLTEQEKNENRQRIGNDYDEEYKYKICNSKRAEDFGDDIDPMDPETIKFSVENDHSALQFLFIGYSISYSNEKGGVSISKSRLEELKAFKPCSDRKYHELTLSSTSDNSICIYESFLDIAGSIPLKFRRKNEKSKDEINILLKNEGEEIENAVRNGELLKALTLLTEKYNNMILVVFYQKIITDNKDKPFRVEKGKLIEMEHADLKNYIGKKGMLYYKKHVSPFLVREYEENEAKQILTTKFRLKPEYLGFKIKVNERRKNNVLAFDAETYRLEDGTCKVFNITIYGKLNNETVEKSFYGPSSVCEFTEYLIDISTKKNNKKSRPKEPIPDILIYGFNNSKFDNLFIYKMLFDSDPGTKFIFTQNAIKKIEFNNISIFDINLYYAGSLKSVSQAFQLEISKNVYPYNFVNANNLYYKGSVPERKYWNSEKDYCQYIDENGDNEFDLKEYTEKYCMLDSRLCYEIAIKHLKECVGVINKRMFDVQMCATGAGIAMKIFKQCFLDKKLIESPKKVTENEKRRYKGGRTEVFKKRFTSNEIHKYLYYYDVNSMYPWAMTELMPDVYLKTEKINDEEFKEDNISKINGYYAKVEYVGNDESFIPNILTRTDEGDIIACKKTDFDWHWGCELIEACKNNCKVIVREVEHYSYTCIDGHNTTFGPYSKYFYNQRLLVKKTNSAKANFFKLLLNSLYGKFGQKVFTRKELVFSAEEMYGLIGQMERLLNFTPIDDMIMVEYERTGDEFAIGKMVRYSSYIAACARSKLSEFMRVVGHENVYYCDTDSVFTTKQPPKDFIHDDILGKWKEETKTPIVSAVFLAPKSYYYVCEDKINEEETIKGKVDKKSKGVRAEKLCIENYDDLASGVKKKISQENDMFKRSFECVKINPSVRRIQSVYNKRIWDDNDSKSFTNIKQWRDTKKYQKTYETVLNQIIRKVEHIDPNPEDPIRNKTIKLKIVKK